MSSFSEDFMDVDQYDWNNSGVDTDESYVALQIYKDKINFLSITKNEKKRALWFCNFILFFSVCILMVVHVMLYTRDWSFSKTTWLYVALYRLEDLFISLFSWFCVGLLLVYVLSFQKLGWLQPNYSRKRVWLKFGTSCSKCFKLAEPISGTQNKYHCHNPNCELDDFSAIPHGR